MTIADKYRLLEQLGGKGKRKFAQVYFGENKITSEKVILKICPKTKNNDILVQRLKQESKFSFVVNGLPEVIDTYESESEFILVKKFVPGISLIDYLYNFKPALRAKKLLEIIHELVPLLNHIHASGIFHLDIKPGNIIIDDSGKLKVDLIDFGMAFSKHEPDQRNTLFPLGYAAPELILNKLVLVDERTDYFALAVTCWHVLMGKIPLVNANPSITTNLQLTHPLPELSRVYQAWNDPIQKLGAKYQFQIPPNRMEKGELLDALKRGMNMRYANLEVFISDIETGMSTTKKSWWHLF